MGWVWKVLVVVWCISACLNKMKGKVSKNRQNFFNKNFTLFALKMLFEEKYVTQIASLQIFKGSPKILYFWFFPVPKSNV